jgi:hypothetical protein
MLPVFKIGYTSPSEYLAPWHGGSGVAMPMAGHRWRGEHVARRKQIQPNVGTHAERIGSITTVCGQVRNGYNTTDQIALLTSSDSIMNQIALLTSSD